MWGAALPEFKEMTFQEKLVGILSYEQIVDRFTPHVVKEELGVDKWHELQKIWKQQVEPTPPDASVQDKYEIAYRNFMRKWVSGNNFVAKSKGDAGTAKYMHAAIATWKQKYARDATALRVIGGVSRKTAFKILAKRLAYQLQAFSPYTVTELTENRMVLKVAPCKILKDPNGISFCQMACQNIVPSWLESQFNVKMSLNRQGENCTVIFTPFTS